MKPLTAVVLGLAALALVTVAWLWRGPAAEHAADSELLARVHALESRLDQLAQRLEQGDGQRKVAVPDVARTTVPDAVLSAEPAPRAGAAAERPAERDPRWYLQQYVLSFENGGEGSEYFRLVVDAYVVELVDAVCMLATDPARPLALRIALARILGKARLSGDPRVLDAFTMVLRQNGHIALAQACLQSWGKVGGADSAPRLEAVVWQLTSAQVRRIALQVLLGLAGAQANATVLRLLASAPDDAAARDLVRVIDGSDLDAALSVLRRASQMNQPVRLAGATRLGDFDGAPFQTFLDDWVRVETDPQVLEALKAAKKQQKTISGWSAMQATGPPNADPRRDDPNAWAPRDGEMGVQWLELGYPSADRISGVRIHEVNAPGAVSELRARDTGGAWHVLWTGTTSATPQGPLVLTFPMTEYRVQTLRIVLDTNRTPGWNEIDAVEILGAGGGQYATSATASSSYSQGRTGAVGDGGAYDLDSRVRPFGR